MRSYTGNHVAEGDFDSWLRSHSGDFKTCDFCHEQSMAEDMKVIKCTREEACTECMDKMDPEFLKEHYEGEGIEESGVNIIVNNVMTEIGW